MSLATAVVIGAICLTGTTVTAVAAQDEYAALGDSFASGNGTRNPDLHAGCYRSSDTYGPIIDRQRANTWLRFRACQGADTTDVFDQQSQPLSTATDYVTVGIGGNDVGFGTLVRNCANVWDEPRCLATVEETHRRIEQELPVKLDTAYATIRLRAPTAMVMSVGYPRFFGADLSCLNAHGITRTEAQALNGVADHLDRVIGQRSAAAGVRYISVIHQFTGHHMCASAPFVNGKAELNTADMYHPSKAGYRYGYLPLIRQAMG